MLATTDAAAGQSSSRSFDDLLARFKAAPSVASDDVVGAVRALLEEVRDLHEAGKVADLDRVDLLALTGTGELRLGGVPTGAPASVAGIARIEAPRSAAVDIVRQVGVREEGDATAAWDRSIAAAGEVPERPLFYPSYGSWERALGHHDALTDIFHLGLLIASLATRLDFRDRDELTRFVASRSNLVRLNQRLHPALARVIADMTAPRRAERAADLSALIDLLDDYRAVEVDDARARARDLAVETDPTVRRRHTQEYFRNRLFEVTRRNKLLYFADRHGVDLTRGSFPLLLNYQTLKPRQLLTTGPDLLGQLARLNDRGEAKGELDLRRWLQCGDYPFLAPAIDKVRLAARKDQRELGFNQLRLVLAFLRWHDDDSAERISTPLVMLPVQLRKQQGTADGFSLVIEAPTAEAEVNPVLRYILAEKFRIELPETLDLADVAALEALRKRLEAEVRRIKPGVAIALVTKPRVELLQKTIRRQLDDHRRRQKRAGQQMKDWRGISYSYAADSWQPLGHELFDRFVRPRPASGREFALAGSTPDVGSGVPDSASGRTTTAETWALETGEASDPLNWEIDLCAVTLANFNTRKMSLVRDYEVLLDGYQGRNANWQRLFEHGARPHLAKIEKPRHSERGFVLPSDPSQDEAILRAATGESYVIQGPPGTGKSQTIANLLADLAHRGKSVLFVCEKRVALDVVHNRLKEAGIGELACLVHDAREDRLEFIRDLKVIYEDWMAGRTSRAARERRAKLAEEIDRLTARLAAFSAAMQQPSGRSATVRALIGHAIAERIAAPTLSASQRERLPSWDALVAGEAALAEVERQIAATGGDREAVAGLARALRTEFADGERPAAFVEAALPEARRALAELRGLAAVAAAGPGGAVTLGTLAAQSALAARLRPLAECGKLNLADRVDPEASRFMKQLEALDRLEAALAAAAAPNGRWTRKPTPAETERALALARDKEGSWLAFLSGEWRALKRTVRAQYGGAPESIAGLMEQLEAEHKARAARDGHAGQLRQTFGLDDLAEARAALEPLWKGEIGEAVGERALIEACLREPKAYARAVLQLAADRGRLERCLAALDRLLRAGADATPDDVDRRLATLDAVRDQAVDLARRARALEQASAELAAAWRELPMDRQGLRAATLHGAIARALADRPEARETRGPDLQRTAEELGRKLAELRQLNARRTLEERKARFRQNSAAQRKDYDAGRAFLEHQFSLSRPSAAMRDFLAGDPALVLRDLKPIWMMSPLSVADTLPLSEQLFDVVVFDEASQIPIEDCVPTLYRAAQAIVVGDEMQLPPPSYFARKLDADEADLPDYVAYGMQAESLLDKAVVALPSTRLDWHYRSRHEGLIGFCNQAFYAGLLKTIPTRQPIAPMPPIDTAEAAPMKALAARVLARPISFHRIAGGSFQGQRNEKEAAYIAELVRALLAEDRDRSIGIVAFSQPQQTAIEEALEKLAGANQAFRARLDKAMAADHEELFVKNLENVQGDERDIMIVSVAYAPGASGRMIMNFGPINQEGGEKRLNVIFSRAKHHMAVVTSIEPAQITNDWNKGANALKRYMMYAAAASVGDAAAMRVALAGYPGAEHVDRSAALPDPLADAIAEMHASAGREVVRGLGQSTARCDVAVKESGAAAFETAILTDNDSHYEVADVVDRYVTYPALLALAGWKVELALAKDWLERGAG